MVIDKPTIQPKNDQIDRLNQDTYEQQIHQSATDNTRRPRISSIYQQSITACSQIESDFTRRSRLGAARFLGRCARDVKPQSDEGGEYIPPWPDGQCFCCGKPADRLALASDG